MTTMFATFYCFLYFFLVSRSFLLSMPLFFLLIFRCFPISVLLSWCFLCASSLLSYSTPTLPSFLYGLLLQKPGTRRKQERLALPPKNGSTNVFPSRVEGRPCKAPLRVKKKGGILESYVSDRRNSARSRRGFPNIRSTISGVPKISIIVLRGLYWVPLFREATRWSPSCPLWLQCQRKTRHGSRVDGRVQGFEPKP